MKPLGVSKENELSSGKPLLKTFWNDDPDIDAEVEVDPDEDEGFPYMLYR